MKTEFLQLLETNYDDAYIAEIKNGTYGAMIREAFAKGDLTSRELHLKEELFKTIDPSDYKIFANPYFIGFGNPNSDILVIGKEKAFPSNNSDLLIKESINNYAQWKVIVEKKLFLIDDQRDIVKVLGFNPLLPKSFHQGKTKGNHTWSKTSSIISQVYPARGFVDDESSNIKQSFFNDCFLTELNHIPAKYHEGSGLSPIRHEFLTSPFFKSFPIVIFSAKSYLKGNDKILSEIFDTKFDSEIELDRYGKDKTKVLNTTKYVSAKQSIYVCKQLSGASGWTNTSLTNFAKQIFNEMIISKDLT